MQYLDGEQRIVGLGSGSVEKRKTWAGYVNKSLIHPDSEYMDNTMYYEQCLCPYCKSKLSKGPVRKTKCKFCEKYIIVRSNYFVGQKMLMTENEAENLRLDRGMYFAEINLDKKRKDIIKSYYTRDEYTKYMLRFPEKNDYDIIMTIFKKSEEEYLKTKQPGLYRALKHSEYYFFVDEGRFGEALETILECYYLEIAATYDVITALGEDMRDIYSKYYHADLIAKINKLNLELKYSTENIKAKFMQQLNKLNYSLKMEEAWQIIEEVKKRQKF